MPMVMFRLLDDSAAAGLAVRKEQLPRQDEGGAGRWPPGGARLRRVPAGKRRQAL